MSARQLLQPDHQDTDALIAEYHNSQGQNVAELRCQRCGGVVTTIVGQPVATLQM